MKNSTSRAYAIGAVIVVIIAGGIYFINQPTRPEISDQPTTTTTTSSSSTQSTNMIAAFASSTSKVATSTKTKVTYALPDTSGWSVYSNSQYSFSISYPGNAEMRDFKGGDGKSYGIGLTLPSIQKGFSGNYFELTVDDSTTTACDATITNEMHNAAYTLIGGVTFLRSEYNNDSPDRPAHVVEYLGRVDKKCYQAHLQAQVTGAIGAYSQTQFDAGELPLENIMHTFKFLK